MEENILSEVSFPTAAPPQAANNGGAIELIWSSANTPYLTAENCKDDLCRSVNVTPDDCTAWTEQKHNLYLNNLEVSFVKQLHQSKSSVAQCSEQFSVLRNGCWQKINYERVEPASRSSADSCNPLKSPWINRLRCMATKGPVPSADNKELLLLHTEKNGKGTISHGVTNQFAASNSDNEGSGQNFMDEGNQNGTNIEFQAKRLKTASADHDQIVPENFNSSLYPPT